MGALGRLIQVGHYLLSRPTADDLRLAALRLDPAEFEIFAAMGPADQAHGARVADRLVQGGAPPGVVAAGYLHDAGKPPSFGLFWRSFAVLWPDPRPPADPPERAPWKRARQIYHWHGHYAAAALARAGASAEVQALVRGEGMGPWADALRTADDRG
ncbi:MAG: hypothetical protein FJZ01_03595 [Candidatus Sericytochromatia bacterium]|nr:hypothetical protein [Candidatus Tanganyikabacteria bacterium]